jgi:hypothetical protein
MQVLHVKDKQFSIEELENTLSKCLPGYYNVVWHTRKDVYDIMLKWDGHAYRDLYKEELYS